jgi:hypothetical protein
VNAELEQLAVDARRTPRADWQGTSGGSISEIRELSAVARTETAKPVEPKALPVPLDHGGRLHQQHRFKAARPNPVGQDPKRSVDGLQPQTTGPLAMQNGHLVTKRMSSGSSSARLRIRQASHEKMVEMSASMLATLRAGELNRQTFCCFSDF